MVISSANIFDRFFTYFSFLFRVKFKFGLYNDNQRKISFINNLPIQYLKNAGKLPHLPAFSFYSKSPASVLPISSPENLTCSIVFA